MKISKKLHLEILAAIDKAAMDVVDQYAPACNNAAPDFWQPEDQKIFDRTHEVSHRARLKIDALIA